MFVRTLLLALTLALLGVVPALADDAMPIPGRLFAGVGLYRISGAYAFDRVTAARARRGTLPALLQVGGVLYRDPGLEAVAHYTLVLDANADGADIQMPLGELRFRFADDRRLYLGVGGGISRGKGRKQSFVETAVIGFEVGPRSFLELRGVTDEGDSDLLGLTVGVRF